MQSQRARVPLVQHHFRLKQVIFICWPMSPPLQKCPHLSQKYKNNKPSLCWWCGGCVVWGVVGGRRWGCGWVCGWGVWLGVWSLGVWLGCVIGGVVGVCHWGCSWGVSLGLCHWGCGWGVSLGVWLGCVIGGVACVIDTDSLILSPQSKEVLPGPQTVPGRTPHCCTDRDC